MEKHFLEDVVAGIEREAFRAEPWYNPHGDCIEFQTVDEAIVADRVDDVLTIYRSALDDRPIGFRVKGVLALVRAIGLEGLQFECAVEGDKVVQVSVTALLLAAYARGPNTVRRRQAYTMAIEQPMAAPLRMGEFLPV